jgi:hypothetical protein
MDEDVQGMLQQFIGQTYGELAKLDKNIVGRTQHLRPQSQEFKAVATNILTNIPNNGQLTQTETPLIQPQNIQPRVQIQPKLPTDQLEFDFDDSATAKNIFGSLKRIEDKLSSISNRLQKLEA